MAAPWELPEASNPLLDAWLASHCCLAWLDALYEIAARRAGVELTTSLEERLVPDHLVGPEEDDD